MLRQLVNAQAGFEQLCQLDFPMETTFTLALDIDKLNGPLAVYDKQRRELVNKLGGPIHDKPDHMGVVPGMAGFAEFTAKHDALLDVELEINIKPISKKFLLAEIKKVKNGEGGGLKIATVLLLGPFLTD